jgi:hypothetical protein
MGVLGNPNEEPALPSNVGWPVCGAIEPQADRSPLLQAEPVPVPDWDEVGFRGDSCCGFAAVKDVATEKTVSTRKHLLMFLHMFFVFQL